MSDERILLVGVGGSAGLAIVALEAGMKLLMITSRCSPLLVAGEVNVTELSKVSVDDCFSVERDFDRFLRFFAFLSDVCSRSTTFDRDMTGLPGRG